MTTAKTTSRRTFLHSAGATAAGVLLSGLPSKWAGGVYAADGPETSTVRFGIIALTDCAPIVMAHELGYFKKLGIDSVISKVASWAVIRDKLSLGENQATHMLLGMPFGSTMLFRIALVPLTFVSPALAPRTATGPVRMCPPGPRSLT